MCYEFVFGCHALTIKTEHIDTQFNRNELNPFRCLATINDVNQSHNPQNKPKRYLGRLTSIKTEWKLKYYHMNKGGVAAAVKCAISSFSVAMLFHLRNSISTLRFSVCLSSRGSVGCCWKNSDSAGGKHARVNGDQECGVDAMIPARMSLHQLLARVSEPTNTHTHTCLIAIHAGKPDWYWRWWRSAIKEAATLRQDSRLIRKDKARRPLVMVSAFVPFNYYYY